MLVTTLLQVIQWWLVLLLLGFLSLPITTAVFKDFLDKGYIFSKVVGVILTSYAIFVLSVLHILPFTLLSLWIVIVSFALATFLSVKKWNFFTFKTIPFTTVICEEILFFVSLLFWSFIRGFQPDIHGLEKYMDFGFVNSILRTTYLPPKDMWMTPLSINYYYFGHLATAVLTRFSLLPSNITFNLMIATLFAFTVVCSFSLGGNLYFLYNRERTGDESGKDPNRAQRQPALSTMGSKLSAGHRPNIILFVLSGLLTAFLVSFAGNLHTLYTLFTPYQNDSPVPPWQLAFSPQTFPNSYWYPNATRFIFHTIHEFPIYSFVVSDLHGHVLDIPFVLLTLGVLLIIFLKPAIPNTKYQILNTLLLGFLCAVMYMTNAWDGLIYLFVSSLILLYKLSQEKISLLFDTVLSVRFLLILISLGATFFVVSLPFSFFFKPFASQIGINCAPKFLLAIKQLGPILFENGYCQSSPWWQLVILYGFFIFWFVSFASFVLTERAVYKKRNSLDTFVLFLGVMAFLLIIAPEFVYLKDIYTTYFRANTMFKLVYQAFIMFSLVSGYSIVRMISNLKTKKVLSKLLSTCYMLIATVLIALVGIYPYFAITSYYNSLKDFKGLDGTKYLSTLYPSDYAGIQWITTHIEEQPIMLEAQGDSYTDYERISSDTGLPTIFGWTVHEWLWRGTYDVAPPRIADVQTIYQTSDVTVAKDLLKKYNVSYVYIGTLERQKYPGLDEKKFEKLGKLVYQNSQTKIYKVRN